MCGKVYGSGLSTENGMYMSSLVLDGWVIGFAERGETVRAKAVLGALMTLAVMVTEGDVVGDERRPGELWSTRSSMRELPSS